MRRSSLPSDAGSGQLREVDPGAVLSGLADLLAAQTAEIERLSARVQELEQHLSGAELLTASQAAARFGLSKHAIYHRLKERRRNGLLEAGAVVEKPLRIDPVAWKQWEQDRSTSQPAQRSAGRSIRRRSREKTALNRPQLLRGRG